MRARRSWRAGSSTAGGTFAAGPQSRWGGYIMPRGVDSRRCVGCGNVGRVSRPVGVCGYCHAWARDVPVVVGDGITSDQLVAWRLKRGHTQRAMADALGVHYSTVSLWEADKRSIAPWVVGELRKMEGVG